MAKSLGIGLQVGPAAACRPLRTASTPSWSAGCLTSEWRREAHVPADFCMLSTLRAAAAAPKAEPRARARAAEAAAWLTGTHGRPNETPLATKYPAQLRSQAALTLASPPLPDDRARRPSAPGKSHLRRRVRPLLRAAVVGVQTEQVLPCSGAWLRFSSGHFIFDCLKIKPSRHKPRHFCHYDTKHKIQHCSHLKECNSAAFRVPTALSTTFHRVPGHFLPQETPAPLTIRLCCPCDFPPLHMSCKQVMKDVGLCTHSSTGMFSGSPCCTGPRPLPFSEPRTSRDVAGTTQLAPPLAAGTTLLWAPGAGPCVNICSHVFCIWVRSGLAGS